MTLIGTNSTGLVMSEDITTTAVWKDSDFHVRLILRRESFIANIDVSVAVGCK